MKRVLSVALVGLGLLSAAAVAAEPVAVFLPTKNIVVTRSVYLVSGKVNNVAALKIDGKVVTYNAKGFFSFPLKVKGGAQPQTVSFRALTDDYRVVTFSRQIFFEGSVPVKSAPSAEKTQPKPVVTSVIPSEKTMAEKSAAQPQSLPQKTDSALVSKKVTQSAKLLVKPKSKPKAVSKKTTAASEPVKKTVPVSKSETASNSEAVKLPISNPEPFLKNEETIYPAELIETTISIPTSPVRTLPTIFVKSPQNNMVTYEPTTTLEGYVRYSREFFINNRAVKLDKDGRFKEDFPLPDIGKFIFNLYAMGEDGLSTTVIRKVFRIDHDSAIAAEKATKKAEPVKSEMVNKLQRKVTVDLQDAEVADVIKILAEKGDLNIVSDKSLVGTVHITLSNVTIQDALDYILNTQGLSYKLVDNTILIGTQENLDKATRIETKVVRLDNVPAKDVAALLADYLKGQEKVQSNDLENIVVVNADSKKMPGLLDLVARLDEKKTSQIILEAQFLEVNQSSLENLGVAWSNAYGIGAQGSYADGAFTYVSNLSISTILNLLKNKGDAKILAKPRIKAVDKEPAEIFIGDNIPYIELATDTSGRTQQSVKFIESGVLLKILPDINPYTQEIKVKFEPEVSYVNGFGGPNNDIPIVRRRKVSTTVNIKNGQTVLIGGLFNSSDSDTYSRFPMLSKIPVLGVFFKTSKTQSDQTELIIAVTPRIIDDHYIDVTGNIKVEGM